MKIPEPPKLGASSKSTPSSSPPKLPQRPPVTAPTDLLTSLGVSTLQEDSNPLEPVFENVERDLVVNANPFLRWFKNVALALIITTVFVAGVGYFTQAPFYIVGASIGIVWFIILAITAPEAIFPYKKTRFIMADKTVKVGDRKPQPMGDFNLALLNTKKKSISIWLENDENSRTGFNVPLKSSKFSMTSADLMSLRTVLPYLSIKASPDVDETNLDILGHNRKVQISSTKIEQIIDELLADM